MDVNGLEHILTTLIKIFLFGAGSWLLYICFEYIGNARDFEPTSVREWRAMGGREKDWEDYKRAYDEQKQSEQREFLTKVCLPIPTIILCFLLLSII